MGQSYKDADLVIARAGSGTITEIIHIKKAAILIPFPHATGQHQTKNAAYLQSLGLCWHIDQTDDAQSDALTLANVIKDIALNPALIKEKENNLAKHKAKKRLDITEAIAQIL